MEDSFGAAFTFVLEALNALDHSNAADIMSHKKRTESLVKLLITKLIPSEPLVQVQLVFNFWDEK